MCLCARACAPRYNYNSHCHLTTRTGFKPKPKRSHRKQVLMTHTDTALDCRRNCAVCLKCLAATLPNTRRLGVPRTISLGNVDFSHIFPQVFTRSFVHHHMLWPFTQKGCTKCTAMGGLQVTWLQSRYMSMEPTPIAMASHARANRSNR